MKGSGATVNRNYRAGATITAGQVVYLDGSSTWQLAVATSSAAANAAGIALHGASSGQPLAVQTGGSITIGGTVTVGTVYTVSSNAAGGVAPIADIDSTNYLTILGVGTTAAIIAIDINVVGVQIP